jgi:hypothetical protein
MQHFFKFFYRLNGLTIAKLPVALAEGNLPGQARLCEHGAIVLLFAVPNGFIQLR